jgi:serine/threonine-protein kinase
VTRHRRRDSEGTRPIPLPAGYRDSAEPIFADGDVVASTYRIRRLLGSGPIGQAFEAADMLLHRLVVLKAAWRDGQQSSLLPEARAFAAVDSPHVVRVHGFAHHHGIELLVVERVAGARLADELADRGALGRGYAAAEALDLLVGIAEALAALHRAGVEHGALTPADIVIAPDGRPVITEVGLGRRGFYGLEERAAAAYLPDIADGDPATSPFRADLTALGVIAVDLLTGGAAGIHAGIERSLSEQPSRAPALRADVPAELADLIAELVVARPGRPGDAADEVLDQLRAIRARVQRRAADPLRVLIVDDDVEAAREMWSRARRATQRAEVDAVGDAAAALERFARQPPDLLLLNPALPTMNGAELCMYLQGTRQAERCTIACVTRHAKPDDLRLLETLGVSTFLVKGEGLGRDVAALVRRMAEAGDADDAPTRPT